MSGQNSSGGEIREYFLPDFIENEIDGEIPKA